ncbi:MAG: hypothetical protein K0R15_2090 [Clostridiales bacterium]|jgi:hypothetical protein|nr:hypothetical protein [Clostridiales bacterium]
MMMTLKTIRLAQRSEYIPECLVQSQILILFFKNEREFFFLNIYITVMFDRAWEREVPGCNTL